MNKYLQNIIREELLNALKEEEIPTSPFTDAEEKFLAKFVELGTQSLGILYTKNEVGIREFLMRSGKDYNLTPDVLSKLMKDGIISIVPYGGYARNEDYTIKCNLPLDELEGLSSGDSKEGDDTGTPPADDAGDTPEPDTAPLDDTVEPQESASSSLDLSKLLVSIRFKKKCIRFSPFICVNCLGNFFPNRDPLPPARITSAFSVFFIYMIFILYKFIIES